MLLLPLTDVGEGRGKGKNAAFPIRSLIRSGTSVGNDKQKEKCRILVILRNDHLENSATSGRLRAWLRPGPENSIWGRGLSERSEFRSPSKRDWGKGTRRATPGREWFWVLLPKQKDLVVRGRNPA